MTEGVVTKEQKRKGEREVGKESEKQERRKRGRDGGEQEWERGKGGGKNMETEGGRSARYKEKEGKKCTIQTVGCLLLLSSGSKFRG